MIDPKKAFHGVFGFPVTPFQQDLSLNLAGLERNCDWMAGFPFCSQVIAGGTGEVYSMTPDESIECVRVAVKAINGRMPVVAGVAYNATIASYMAREMEKAGAEALLVMPPYYINAPEEGMIQYFEAIANSCGLALSFYTRDWAGLAPAQVKRLLDRVPSLKMWKDGQGDMRKYQRIIGEVGDRLAWVGGIGDDCAPGYFAVGCQAYTSSISNIAPKLSLKIAELGLAGDFKGLAALMTKYVHPLYALRDRKKGYEVSMMKSAMEILGHPAGPVRPPLVNITAEEHAELQKLMEIYADYI
ncbi:MAG TPA: dihydrodipicolinate synthase family protein [Bryobacteraceae bacterium]|nr:dihydrodipicolinate synthase family protein [Bryobacteraceae bacterium]